MSSFQNKNKLALRLLRSFCPPHLLEEIEGDLIQKFEMDVKAFGERKAKRRLLWNVIRFFRPGIFLRNKLSLELDKSSLIKNYLKTTIRIFISQKSYSFINVMGLSIALTSVILIAIYVIDELSYDRFFTDAEKIYRIGTTERFHGDELNYTSTPAPLAEVIRNEVPEVIASVRIGLSHNYLVRFKDKVFKESGFIKADSNFFKFFDYDLIEGDRETCLRGPNKVMLSESTALKFFGKSDASILGKLMVLGTEERTAMVSGIFKDVPKNTHLKFDLALSADSWDYALQDQCWACYNLYTYFKVNEASSLSAVQKKLNDIVEDRVLPRIEASLNVTHDQFIKSGDYVAFFVQSLTSIHLYSHTDEEYEPGSDIRYVYLFEVIGIFIILIACINFVNLTTARASSRAKEVGVRKTIGAFKASLVGQFMIESFFYMFASSLLSVILVILLIPYFNDFTGKNLTLYTLANPYYIFIIVFSISGIGVLSGIYPAFVLTSFKPVDTLKGNLTKGINRLTFRNALVVFQFVVSITLIISTLIIYRQLRFIQEQNLGFDKENVLRISGTDRLGDNAQVFKDRLLAYPEFMSVSYADQLPPHLSNTLFMKSERNDIAISSYYTSVDYDHLATMKYQMNSGRFFSRNFVSDTSAVIINETSAKLLGFESHEGRQVTFGDLKKHWHVIGIIKDFNFESLRGGIKPLVMFIDEYPGVTAVRMTPGDEEGKVKLVASIWKETLPGVPFQYSFVDEDFNALFHSEQQMGKLFWFFTLMAIFIACLGLIGLITFVSVQRAKEMGIRKIFGASIPQIVWLLSGNLIRLIVLAFLIAIPISWYGINQWLQGFAYRISFDFTIVIISGTVGVLIALITVSYQSYSTASRNPIESLRNE